MNRRAQTLRLHCPVETDDEPCEQEIEVTATPERPSRGWDPGEGATIDDIRSKCGHQLLLESGLYDPQLWRQIEEY